MKITKQNSNSPSYTSVIPTRVIINNHVSIHPENVKIATRGLQKILTSPSNGDPLLIAIKSTFCKVIKDFQYYSGQKYESGTLMRNITDVDVAKFTKREPDSGLAYIFTGEQVLALAERGKQIGPERTQSDKYFKKFGNITNKAKIKPENGKQKRVRSFEELEKDIRYYDKIKEFLSRPKLFATAMEGQFKNQPVELFINATKDSGGKIKIENIAFKPIKQVSEKGPETVEIETKLKPLSKRTKVKNKIKNIIKDTQQKLIF